MVTLRPYQQDCIEKIIKDLSCGRHTVAALPTGSGKGVIIAELCRRLDGRILVVTHRKELLAQNSAQLARLAGDAESGIYSAGLSRRDTDARVIFGGVASIYRRMAELQQSGDFHAIIVDEAHACAPSTVDSMYATVFRACPDARRIGLTATPYRLDNGPIWGENGSWFDSLAVDVSAVALTAQGYLAPLVGVQAAKDIDLTGVRTRQGDYVASDISQVMSDEQRVKASVNEIASLAANRASWLVFCCDVAHVSMVHAEMQNRGILARMVTGSTPQEERDRTLAEFKTGRFRALLNCSVLTTGYDAPNVDCVILMRPTQSKSLLVQMLGRGTRLHPGKEDCCVLDYADTIRHHMPLDEIPQHSFTKTATIEAQEDREREERAQQERDHARHQESLFIEKKRAAYAVQRVSVEVVNAKSQMGKKNLRVTYLCPTRTPSKWVTIWLCPEYQGYPRLAAEAWFQRRQSACPRHAAPAGELAKRLRIPKQIVVDETKQFPRILVEQFDDEPIQYEAFF